MKDENLVQNIAKAAASLNKALDEAIQGGLRVQIYCVEEDWNLGRRIEQDWCFERIYPLEPVLPNKGGNQAAGGHARAKKLSPGRRKEIAQKAANKRWVKSRSPDKV